MTETHTPQSHRPQVRPARRGGRFLAWLVGGLIVVAAVIGWVFHAGGRMAAPEPPAIKLDIPMPEPRLPRPVEPPNVTAPATSSTPGPET